MATAQKLLLEGVSDAVCFVLGALSGYGLAQVLGIDIFAQGYSGAGIAGIALVGLGGGAGLHLARAVRNRQRAKARQRPAPTD